MMQSHSADGERARWTHNERGTAIAERIRFIFFSFSLRFLFAFRAQILVILPSASQAPC